MFCSPPEQQCSSVPELFCLNRQRDTLIMDERTKNNGVPPDRRVSRQMPVGRYSNVLVFERNGAEHGQTDPHMR